MAEKSSDVLRDSEKNVLNYTTVDAKQLNSTKNFNKNKRELAVNEKSNTEKSSGQEKSEKTRHNKKNQNKQKNRSKKASGGISHSPLKISSSTRVNAIPHNMFVDDKKTQKKFASRLSRQQVPKRQEFKVKMPLFSHLVQMERNVNMAESISLGNSSIHPSFIALGLRCADGLIFSSRTRSVKLIQSLKIFINDYCSHPSKDFPRDFETKLSPSLSFLSECRPNSVGMANIIKFLKVKSSELFSLNENDLKLNLNDFLDSFLNERIFLAGDIISSYVCQKVVTDDIILTFSLSDIVLKGLIDASKEDKRFKVIIVDSLPRFDGRQMLKLLFHHNIKCTYIGLNALSTVMGSVTKIIICADSLQSNGAVLSQIGSAMIATVGNYYHVPFLICCETYNFSERAQMDAFVYNELGDPDDILDPNHESIQHVKNWKDNPRITLLNLFYDVIQPKYVTAVLTELGIIPCSSAPVVLRIKN